MTKEEYELISSEIKRMSAIDKLKFLNDHFEDKDFAHKFCKGFEEFLEKYKVDK